MSMGPQHIKSMYEVFDELSKIKDVEELKSAFLKVDNLKQIKDFLDITFNLNFEWSIPEGAPNYEPSDSVDSQSKLYSDMKQFAYFFEKVTPNISKIRREQLFISFLEGLDKNDASMVVYVKDNRKLPFKTLTKQKIEKVFPELEERWKLNV